MFLILFEKHFLHSVIAIVCTDTSMSFVKLPTQAPPARGNERSPVSQEKNTAPTMGAYTGRILRVTQFLERSFYFLRQAVLRCCLLCVKREIKSLPWTCFTCLIPTARAHARSWATHCKAGKTEKDHSIPQQQTLEAVFCQFRSCSFWICGALYPKPATKSPKVYLGRLCWFW